MYRWCFILSRGTLWGRWVKFVHPLLLDSCVASFVRVLILGAVDVLIYYFSFLHTYNICFFFTDAVWNTEVSTAIGRDLVGKAERWKILAG